LRARLRDTGKTTLGLLPKEAHSIPTIISENDEWLADLSFKENVEYGQFEALDKNGKVIIRGDAYTSGIPSRLEIVDPFREFLSLIQKRSAEVYTIRFTHTHARLPGGFFSIADRRVSMKMKEALERRDLGHISFEMDLPFFTLKNPTYPTLRKKAYVIPSSVQLSKDSSTFFDDNDFW